MSTTQPLPQFPFMQYLDNVSPWGKKKKKKKKRKRNTIYMVPCRFCKRKTPLRTIGAKSEMCEGCFTYSLGRAFARYCH